MALEKIGGGGLIESDADPITVQSVVAEEADLPDPATTTAGDLAFVAQQGQTYVSDGSAWSPDVVESFEVMIGDVPISVTPSSGQTRFGREKERWSDPNGLPEDGIVDNIVESQQASQALVDIDYRIEGAAQSSTAMGKIAGSQTTMEPVANSEVAMNAVADSEVASNAVVNSQTAMDEIASSQLAMNIASASQTAMDEIASSQLAMDTVSASQTAMDEVVASQLAIDAVYTSQTAIDSLTASQTAMDTLSTSDMAMNALAASQTVRNAIGTEGLAYDTIASNETAIKKYIAGIIGLDPTNVESIDSLITDNDTMETIASSETAMNAIAGSSPVMEVVASTQSAIDIITSENNKSLSSNTVLNSSTATTEFQDSSLKQDFGYSFNDGTNAGGNITNKRILVTSNKNRANSNVFGRINYENEIGPETESGSTFIANEVNASSDSFDNSSGSFDVEGIELD